MITLYPSGFRLVLNGLNMITDMRITDRITLLGRTDRWQHNALHGAVSVTAGLSESEKIYVLADDL